MSCGLSALLLGSVGLGVGACGSIDSEVGAVFHATGGVAAAGGTPAASGGSGGADVKPTEAAPLGIDLTGSPIYTRVQRLTNSQWQHAVKDILRLPASTQLDSQLVPPAQGVTEFSNNERVLKVNAPTVEAFELAAEAAAQLATGSPAALAALYPATDAEGFVRELGRRAFRRPLTSQEEKRYLQVFARGEEIYGAGFANGAALVVRAMLQSSAFLYRSELGAAASPLSGYELASKLSFWLLDTTPSDALLDAASAGMLDDPEVVEATARDMLEQPAASSVMRDFHGQLYRLDRFRNLAKTNVPAWTSASSPEFEEASYRFFDAIFSRDWGVEAVFTSTRAFVGPKLAPFYGIKDAPTEIEERDLGPSRVGYFMQVPFLSLTGLNEEPWTIRRGGELIRALCDAMGPPAGTFSLPPLAPGQTNRERVTATTEACGSACHGTYLNPLGYAFEGFDGLGSVRDQDNGQPIDASGSYPLGDGVVQFADAQELMQSLAQQPQAHACFAKKMASYALQRDIVDADRELVDSLTPVSRGGSIKDVIAALVRSPAFRLREKDLP